MKLIKTRPFRPSKNRTTTMSTRDIHHVSGSTQLIKWLWLASVFVLLAGCNNNDSSTVNSSTHIDLALHAPIQEIIKHNKIAFSKECIKRINMCWYKFNRSANGKNLPYATIKSNETTLTLQDVTSVTIVIDGRMGQEVESINVSLRGLPDNSSHEQNRDFIYEVIETLKSSGWKHYFSPADPRISGAEASKISTPRRVLGEVVSSHPWLDPDYKPDMDKWLQIGMFYAWHFYNNGAHLTLKAWRQNFEPNPTQRGTYLITMEFNTEHEYWMSGFTETKERARWKELLPEDLKQYHARRLLLEEKARAAGIEIDEAYQDPPIQFLKNSY
ncbi:hypothetical protein ACW9H6_26830 [Pseudomonas sp. SDO528_S397]